MVRLARNNPAVIRGIVIAGLAALGLGSWWWLSLQREELPPVAAARHPDSYFRALDVLRHTETGNPEMRVTADYAEHFADEPWIHLRTLRAQGLAAGPAWQLRADAGRLSDDGVYLEARGNVELTRGIDAQEMKLITERLDVNTDRRVATTDAPVRLSQGAGWITGTGLRASLADDRLELKADVEARYEK